MKVFLQRILQEIMKKNNTWNIKHLVDDSFVPSTQRPSVNLSWIDESLFEAKKKKEKKEEVLAVSAADKLFADKLLNRKKLRNKSNSLS